MGLTIKNGFLITYCKFKPIDHEKYDLMNIKTEDDYDVFRIRMDAIVAWNQADEEDCTTIRTASGDSFTIFESVSNIDKYFLDEQHN
jgi:hypothetical protein